MPRIISNSEVTAYNECARRHWYQYQEGLQPRSYGLALTRGIIGHEALERYYLTIMNGGSVEDAKHGMFVWYDNYVTEFISYNPTEFDKIMMLSQLRQLLERYVEFYRNDDFNVLAVEHVYTAPVDDFISYGMKLDVLIELTSGLYRGELAIFDHKFLYNFKSDEELSIDGQLPKYIRTVAGSGIHVTRGIFNQIRYRELKNDDPEAIFRRTYVKPSKAAKEGIWEEQRDASIEIVNNPRPPRRTLSPLVCKNCYFLQLCRADLNGEPTGTIRKIDYKPLIDRYMDWSGD